MKRLAAVIAALSYFRQHPAVVLTVLLALAMIASQDTLIAQPSNSNTASMSTAATPNIIKYAPNLKVSSLAGRADTDIVEFSDGRRMRVGDIRRLQVLQQKMRAAVPGSRLTAALKVKPATTGIQIKNAADLAAALKRPDNETVKLPSGRLVTVGQIKLLQPLLEKRLGRKLEITSLQPDRSGPALKISKTTTREQWKSILQKPDNTVLESPNGKRITVGELKQWLPGINKNPTSDNQRR